MSHLPFNILSLTWYILLECIFCHPPCTVKWRLSFTSWDRTLNITIYIYVMFETFKILLLTFTGIYRLIIGFNFKYQLKDHPSLPCLNWLIIHTFYILLDDIIRPRWIIFSENLIKYFIFLFQNVKIDVTRNDCKNVLNSLYSNHLWFSIIISIWA